jgi:hypothetical protein
MKIENPGRPGDFQIRANADGTLGHRSNFALLSLLVPDKVRSWWPGPDSMKIDGKSDMYRRRALAEGAGSSECSTQAA